LKIYVNRLEKTFIFKGFQAAFSFYKFHRKAFLGEVFFYTNRLDLKVKIKNYVIFSLPDRKNSKKQHCLQKCPFFKFLPFSSQITRNEKDQGPKNLGLTTND